MKKNNGGLVKGWQPKMVEGVAVFCSGVGAGQERSLITCIGSESSQARVGQESRPAGHLTFRLN